MGVQYLHLILEGGGPGLPPWLFTNRGASTPLPSLPVSPTWPIRKSVTGFRRDFTGDLQNRGFLTFRMG